MASYTAHAADGSRMPNPDIAAVLQACPSIAATLVWVDATNMDVPYASWPSAMQQRLANLYGLMLSGAAIPDLACPDPRGADSARAITNGGFPHGTVPGMLFFTTAEASDMYLASVAHALALEVRGDLPWSLLDYPTAELGPLLSARATAAPVSQPPRPFGSPLPGATYQVPIAHVNSLGFVCDPRVGYDFIRGKTSETHADLLASTPEATLANLTLFLTQNSVHGFPYRESIDTFSFSLTDRLHRGLNLTDAGSTPAPWLVDRVGCHSTGELLEELARVVNVPLRNLGSYTYAWTDGTNYSFRDSMHRGLAYAWTRPNEARILPHADFVDATGLWPNYRVPFAASDYYAIVWRTPASYLANGLLVDTTMPTVPILPANSDGSFETYFDFGPVLSVLLDEGRYYLRTEACAWDIVRSYCINPSETPAAFGAADPYGGYAQYSDAGLLQAAYTRAAACIAALPGGCSAVPTSYPNFVATNYLP
jgi:hypothetical protein